VSLPTSALRSFERVDLDIIDLDFDFTVSSEVTEAGRPFFDRRGSLDADRADGAFDDVIATFAHFDNGLAAATFTNTTGFTPEGTFCTGKNCLTLHEVLLMFCACSGFLRGIFYPFLSMRVNYKIHMFLSIDRVSPVR